MENISIKNIKMNQTAQDWQQALTITCNVLVESGSITNEYTKACIDSVLKYGPYIVLSPGFALAHSRPSEAVIKSDMSLVVFDNDILFGSDNDPVRVIICLACTDNIQHVERLSKIGEKMFEDEHLIEKIIQCKTLEDISILING